VNQFAQKLEAPGFLPVLGETPALSLFRTLPFLLSLVTATGMEDFEEIEDPGDLLLLLLLIDCCVWVEGAAASAAAILDLRGV